MKLLKAFTLIELLIVIVVIAILATSLIPRLKGLQDKAKYTRVEKDFDTLRATIFMAHSRSQKTLKQITDTGFSAGACTSGAPSYIYIDDLRSVANDHRCRGRWRQSLSKIALAAGMEADALVSLETDPWGSPYLLDENEAESGVDDCRSDWLRSVGPDGKPRSGDDIVISVAAAFCPSAY